MKTIRIFISSPGDVAYERSLAAEILSRVAKEFDGRLVVEPYFWEHDAFELTRSFQHQIPTPGADPQANYDLMVCFLWSRLGSRLHGSLKLPDGSEAKSGTQFEVEWALHAKKLSGAPEVYLWLNKSEPVIPLEPVAEHNLRFGQYQALKEFITRLTTEDGTFVGASNDYKNLGEFEDLFEAKLRKILERHAADIPAATISSPRQPSWTAGSPFRGLRPFEREHAPVFFGRTSAIGNSLALLRKSLSGGSTGTGDASSESSRNSTSNPPRGFQLILGASGVGKSSLARAGLIPALTTPGVIDGAALWRTAIVKPSDARGRLFEGLAAALLAPGAFPELAGDGTDTSGLAARLADQPGRVVEAILGALREAAKDLMRDQRAAAEKQAREYDALGRPEDARTLRERATALRPPKAMGVLLVDQLEELFTRSSDHQQRGRFVETLRYLAESGRVVVLATMRADFYGRIAEEPVLADLAAGIATILLKPATANELGQLIRLPAAAAGLAFEANAEGKSLDEELRDLAAKYPQILPLLEFALDLLYEKRDGHLLTWQSYRDVGGLEGALAKHAEDALTSLESDQQRECLNAVFGKLVALSVGDDEVPVRRVATMEELVALPHGEGELPGARAFVERFVERRLLVASLNTHSGTVTYAIAHEALLRSWEKLRTLIKDRAEFLRIRERAEHRLHDWQNQAQDKSLLLPEGLAVNELEKLLRDAPELATPALGEYYALSLAAIQRRKRRTNRIRNGVVAVLTVLLALAAWQWREADTQKNQAKDNARTANSHLAEANWIVGQSTRGTDFYPHRESVIEAAHYLLKAANAAQRAGDEKEARSACLAAVFAASPLRATLVHDEAVDGVDYSPDQHRILAWNRGGTLWVWDMTNGIPVGRPGVFRAEGAITRAWFDTNGRQIIALLSVPFPGPGDRTASAQWWDIATRVSTRFPLAPPAHVIGVSPDGICVLIRTQTNTVQWWNAAGDRALGPAITLRRPFRQAGFVGDEILFALSDDGLELYHAKQNPTHRFLPEAWFKNESGLKHSLLSADGRRALLRSIRTFSLPGTEASGRAKNRPLDYSGGGLVDALTSERMRGLASVGYRGVAWLFDTETGRQIAEYDQQSQAVYEFSPDGRHFVMASAHETVMFYSALDGQSIGQPVNHEGLRGAAFSPDGQLALTWSDDSLQAWEVPSGQPVGQPIKETGRISNARFSPDGHQVLTWGDGNTVRIWLLGAPYQVGRPMPHETISVKARFTSDGRRVLTEVRHSRWYVWDAVDGKPLASQSFSLDKDAGVWSPDGQRVLCWHHDESAATLYNVRDGIPVGEQIVVEVNEAIGGAVFSPDGSRLLVWSTGGVVAGGVVARLVDCETGMPVGEPLVVEQGFGPPRFDFSLDGKLCLTWGKSAQLWQARLGLPTGSPMSHRDGITGVKFSEDSQRLATWSNERKAEVRLWSVPTGQALAKPLLHSNPVIDATFNRDGQRVLTSSSDDHIRLWDAASGECLGQPIPHERLAPLVFAPDGVRFLTLWGGSVLQWNSSDGSPTAIPIKHVARGATFIGNDLWIVTWGGTTARLWSASNGQCIAVFHHAWNVTGATYDRSQRRLLTTSEDGTAWLWDLSLDERVAIDERVLEFEIRSGTKLDQVGGVRQLSFSEWEQKKSQLQEIRHRQETHLGP